MRAASQLVMCEHRKEKDFNLKQLDYSEEGQTCQLWRTSDNLHFEGYDHSLDLL